MHGGVGGHPVAEAARDGDGVRDEGVDAFGNGIGFLTWQDGPGSLELGAVRVEPDGGRFADDFHLYAID